MGASASGLALAPGVIGIREMQQGVIHHALQIGLPEIAYRTGWSYPAQRSDGQEPDGTPNAIMEGQRFRLDPSVDVASLGLTPIATAVARSAQKYGFIVTDRAGTLTINTESGQAAAQATGTNPWTRMMGGSPRVPHHEELPVESVTGAPSELRPGSPRDVPPRQESSLGPSRWLLGRSATFHLSSSLPDSTFICRLDGDTSRVRAPRPPSQASPKARIGSRSARWEGTGNATRPPQSAGSRCQLTTPGCA